MKTFKQFLNKYTDPNAKRTDKKTNVPRVPNVGPNGKLKINKNGEQVVDYNINPKNGSKLKAVIKPEKVFAEIEYTINNKTDANGLRRDLWDFVKSLKDVYVPGVGPEETLLTVFGTSANPDFPDTMYELMNTFDSSEPVNFYRVYKRNGGKKIEALISFNSANFKRVFGSDFLPSSS